MAHVKDIVNSQPADLYSQIKNRLIATYSISNEAKLRQLLKGEVVNEGKPSLLLNQLRSLNDNACGDDVIKSIFLDQLPGSIRAILAMSQVSDLSALATLADKVCEASNPSGFQTFAVTPHTTPHAVQSCAMTNSQSSMDPLADIISRLSKQVEQLSKKLNKLEHHRGRSRSQSTSRGNTGSRNRSKSFNRRKTDMCYYHARFGKNALKCEAPCSWNSKNVTAPEN